MNTIKTLYMNLLRARVDVQSLIVRINDSREPKDAQKLQPELEKALQNEQLALNTWLDAIRGKSQSMSTITISQFKKLPPGKRLEFAKAGGKVVDD